MSKKPQKSQARSSRIVVPQTGPNLTFGSDLSSKGFGSAPSALSYIAEQPDLTSISDPNTVVQFKNVAKKDSTTKAKALEDLQANLTSVQEEHNDVQEAFLAAWVKVYPRLSIDTSRRVRQLAHSFHGLICLRSGKRAARYMPDVIGAWFAGARDSDRAVSRAANEAFNSVFPSAEKQEAIPKVYQTPILDFCINAISKESVQSLSDERTTNAEDAEAKFYRVLSCSVLSICVLLERLPFEEVSKHPDLYAEILGTESFWDLLASKDQTTRRAVLKLIRSCTEHHKELISPYMEELSTAILSKKVARRQRGTTLDYAASLMEISNSFPFFWTLPAISSDVVTRLSEFVKYGSQGAHEAYWKLVSDLFIGLPDQLIPQESNAAIQMMNAIKDGFNRKEEPRSNIDHGWECYIQVANRVSSLLTLKVRQEFISASVLPMVQQYINPGSQSTEWTIAGTRPVNTVATLMRSALVQNLCEHFPGIANDLCEGIKTVAPEQSRDFESSQIAISERGIRWFKLYATLPEHAQSSNGLQTLQEGSLKITTVSLEVLIARLGKPFGAAKILETAVSVLKPWAGDVEVSRILDSFLTSNIPLLMFSPSRSQAISILYECFESPSFLEAWNNTLETVVEAESSDRLPVLQEFLTCSKAPSGFEEPVKSPKLQKLLRNEADRSIEGHQDWRFLISIAAAPAFCLSHETVDHMLSGIAEALVDEGKAPAALSALELFVNQSQQKLLQSLQYQADSSLRQNILLLTESEDESLSERAAELNRSIERGVSNISGAAPAITSTLTVISIGLCYADQRSLSIETLVELALRHIERSQLKDEGIVKQILPSFQNWNTLLEYIMQDPIPPSFALSSQLGGTLFLIDVHAPERSSTMDLQYDRDGYSVPLRMAFYALNIAEDSTLFDQLTDFDRSEIFRLLLLTFQLMDDNITVSGSNKLWVSRDNSIEEEMLRYASRAGLLFKKWLLNAEGRHKALESKSSRSFVEFTKAQLLKEIQSPSALAVRYARAYCYVATESLETHGWNASFEESVSTRFEQLRHSDNIIQLLTIVIAYHTPLSGSQAYSKSCNELLANLTGAKLDESPAKCLRNMILLDTMLQGQDHLIDAFARQRVVFFVKNITPWLHSEQATEPMRTEVYNLLAIFLPSIKDVYGSHWTDTLGSLINWWDDATSWERDQSSSRLPLEYAALRLLEKLRELALDDDVNDDLKDALQESSESIANTLIAQLGVLNINTDEFDQHLRTVNELLCRQIAAFHVQTTIDPASLYALIAMESESIQRTAFDILHKQIPKAQEQISVDTALEKTTAKLPDELLSLIIEAPLPRPYASLSSQGILPPAVRGYLSCWLLVFDHFKGSSDKVKNDYTTHLKDGDYLAALLDFTCNTLGHSKGRPVDVSKFDITVYSFDIEDSTVKDLQWLLTHLYFLSLKHIPGLTRAWYINCSSRQTKINVESWTEKFISPHLISDALSVVDEWAKKQDESSGESVTVKTNPRTKEITVSKDIDDQIMSMAIRLPDDFPLGQAKIQGINRVAVDEKKWRNWLLNSEGVITFSNNSLIDGIVAFKRNVVGALKGQTECAICYAIVAADKQLPTKKCGTCNNLFHSGCLYRWFKSSNSSSCPLCRNPFNYT